MDNQEPTGVSLEGLHYLLWQRSTNGRLRLKQSELAAEMLLSRQRITQLFDQLEQQGRLARTSQRSVWDITDPATMETS